MNWISFPATCIALVYNNSQFVIKTFSAVPFPLYWPTVEDSSAKGGGVLGQIGLKISLQFP